LNIKKIIFIFFSIIYFSCSDKGIPTEQNELPLEINFGNILNGAYINSTLNISSSQTASLVIKKINIENCIDSCFSISNFQSPQLIQSGSETNLPVKFSPTISGLHSGEVIIETDRDPFIISLSGISVEPASLFLREYSISFDEKLTGSTYEKELKLYNIGENHLEILSLEISNSIFNLCEHTFPFIIEGGDSASLTIFYYPEDEGLHNAELNIQTQLASGVTSVIVSGVGKSPIQFISEILPIFQNNCTMCHGGLSGVSLTTQGEVLNSIGEQYGTKIIIPGDSENSPLINKINSSFPQFGSRMPLDNPTYFENFPENLQLMKDWIDQLEEY
jgi:hypothetical protein